MEDIIRLQEIINRAISASEDLGPFLARAAERGITFTLDFQVAAWKHGAGPTAPADDFARFMQRLM